MDRRFLLFIVLSVAILTVNNLIWNRLNPPPPQVAQKAGEREGGEKKADANDAKKGDQKPDEKNPDDQKPDKKTPAVVAQQPEEPEVPLERFTLGSVDPTDDNPYRFGAIVTNRGAAVERVELASERFRDLDDRSGYLGHLAPEDTADGVKVNVVVPGTPAATAGLKVGDVINSINGKAVKDAKTLVGEVLAKTEPGQTIEIGILRSGEEKKLSTTLVRRPLEVVRPEVLPKGENIPVRLDIVEPGNHDPFSFLLTLQEIDSEKLDGEKIDAELPGVNMRNVNWTGKQIDADTVEFTRPLTKFGLEAVKRYRIVKKADNTPAYNLMLEVELRNVGEESHKVAYQLDGPTGLPIEGWWYSSRPSRTWSGIGVRDAAMLLQGQSPALVSPVQIGDNSFSILSEDPGRLAYAGVDAQFFAAALLTEPLTDRPPWLSEIKPILAGRLPAESAFRVLGNVTCRLISVKETLKPSGKLKHSYTVFLGPKQPDLLAQYGTPSSNLGELIYYGWPIWGFFAKFLTRLLHFFYGIVGNYGIAIILLTVVVRACMFPLSRKQALGAQKMQELKPEMDKINEKYKGKPEDKTRAMQELWRKHNYNPMSGCLMAFVQLPIFLGLYRALMVDVELRQAPLLGESIRWCSNLAAPDMLLNWSGFMPSFITAYRGFLSLGPYLNILPIITVGLFIWQQKMFMPPATDEQTRMQQKMMKYMMVLIAFMFYTVPAGLCIYFIASSCWGIAERKLLPKTLGSGEQKKTDNGPSALSKLLGKATETNGQNIADARRERRKQRGGK